MRQCQGNRRRVFAVCILFLYISHAGREHKKTIYETGLLKKPKRDHRHGSKITIYKKEICKYNNLVNVFSTFFMSWSSTTHKHILYYNGNTAMILNLYGVNLHNLYMCGLLCFCLISWWSILQYSK